MLVMASYVNTPWALLCPPLYLEMQSNAEDENVKMSKCLCSLPSNPNAARLSKQCSCQNKST